MIGENFKQGKPIDFEKPIKAYVTKNYDANSYASMESFVKELTVTRNKVVNAASTEIALSSLKDLKDSIIAYLNMLNFIKSKINFGNDQFSLKVEFIWRDTVKDTNVSSYNIAYEINCGLFNLGVCNNLIAKLVNPDTDDELKLKESIKQLEFCAGIMDKIKTDLPAAVTEKEIPMDMSANYLQFLSNVFLAQAQSYLLKVADRKNSSNELRAMLAKGIADFYNNSVTLMNDPSLVKGIDDKTKIYITYKKMYYNTIALLKYKDFLLETSQKTGEGYGKVVAFFNLANQSANQPIKDLAKIKQFVDLAEYEKFKTAIGNGAKEISDKNKSIYMDFVPTDLSALPKIDKKIMVSVKQMPEDISGLNMNFEGMDSLVPKQVKNMVDKYKDDMSVYVSNSLDKFENENSIIKFLYDLNLPYSLEVNTGSDDIPESIWNKISAIQVKGGTSFILSQMENLEKKNHQLSEKLKEILKSVTTEEELDNGCRKTHGDKWRRAPSNMANMQFKQSLIDYTSKLDAASKCDLQTKSTIQENCKYFELVSMEKEKLIQKIPIKSEKTNIKESEEVKEIKAFLESLSQKKDKLLEIVNSIFSSLNENNVVTSFIKVLQNKATENSVFHDKKLEFDEKLKQLETVSDEIRELKGKISEKMEAFNKLQQNASKLGQENENFFKELDNYTNIFNGKLNNINQGMNFYNQLSQKIEEVNNHIKEFVNRRNLERENLEYNIKNNINTPQINQNIPSAGSNQIPFPTHNQQNTQPKVPSSTGFPQAFPSAQQPTKDLDFSAFGGISQQTQGLPGNNMSFPNPNADKAAPLPNNIPNQFDFNFGFGQQAPNQQKQQQPQNVQIPGTSFNNYNNSSAMNFSNYGQVPQNNNMGFNNFTQTPINSNATNMGNNMANAQFPQQAKVNVQPQQQQQPNAQNFANFNFNNNSTAMPQQNQQSNLIPNKPGNIGNMSNMGAMGNMGNMSNNFNMPTQQNQQAFPNMQNNMSFPNNTANMNMNQGFNNAYGYNNPQKNLNQNMNNNMRMGMNNNMNAPAQGFPPQQGNMAMNMNNMGNMGQGQQQAGKYQGIPDDLFAGLSLGGNNNNQNMNNQGFPGANNFNNSNNNFGWK